MMKVTKLTTMAVAGLLACGASARADVLLYGWDGSQDGWASTHIVGTTAPGDRGVTQGAGALVFTGGTHDYSANQDQLIVSPAASVVQALQGNTEISFDAIMLATGYTGYQNVSFGLYFRGEDSEGNFFEDSATFDAAKSSVSYNANSSRVTSDQATLVFDYSGVAGGDLTAGTIQSLDAIGISTGFAGGSTWPNDTNNKVVVDNFRVVPEPATLTLAGLGGLMVLGRRRRARA